MDASLKPQPLIADVLPGFATLCIIGIAYLADHPGEFASFVHNKSAAEIVAAGFGILLVAWIVGTVFDAIRDLVEHLLDRKWPVNWRFLFDGPAEDVRKLDEAWLAYYFLSGNTAISLLTCAACGLFVGAVHMSGGWLALLIACSILFAASAVLLRGEIRKLIGFEKNQMPHEGVFARIASAATESDPEKGVGLFAIRHIPKGTYVFFPDDDRTVTVNRDQIETLEPEIKKLYQDFCVLEGDRYICPLSFNKLTPSWYANTSDNPNIAPDEDLRFRAIRDIAAGEELTSRYEDFSENEERPLGAKPGDGR